ncbi:uncharacterized protein LOC125944395 [Dermacentor silvarum]|uniref:uncharacterized protein LOC125944395 n=1 Tax=Dermacentor silvarum TaxID=543639 RepID=UPI002101A7B1|nr:uncharacterized protein LOC125944395 [Dermacentor silvarum]
MTNEGDARGPIPVAPGSMPAGTWRYYREPRVFAGRAGEDVEEWLRHYQRVSKSNGWNTTDQLTNVIFALSDTALMWFENHEELLTTWERFVHDLKECFGDSDAKKKRAEHTLAQRAQLPGETCTAYIEEILKLCKQANARMSEEDKVGHLLKGIAEDVYNFLIGKDSLASVSDVMKHCRTFEALKMRRITPKFGRLANVTTVASIDMSSSFDLASTIRQIVREELDRHTETTRRLPDVSDASFSQAPATSPPLNGWQPSVSVANVSEYRHAPASSLIQDISSIRSSIAVDGLGGHCVSDYLNPLPAVMQMSMMP